MLASVSDIRLLQMRFSWKESAMEGTAVSQGNGNGKLRVCLGLGCNAKTTDYFCDACKKKRKNVRQSGRGREPHLRQGRGRRPGVI
jgi:hypothetical protein